MTGTLQGLLTPDSFLLVDLAHDPIFSFSSNLIPHILLWFFVFLFGHFGSYKSVSDLFQASLHISQVYSPSLIHICLWTLFCVWKFENQCNCSTIKGTLEALPCFLPWIAPERLVSKCNCLPMQLVQPWSSYRVCWASRFPRRLHGSLAMCPCRWLLLW